jgi:ABC-2 type transport system permease protein
MRSLPALTHVSFQNCIRQPFFPLITVLAYIFILSSPAFTMFTMLNARILILDMSMATILMVVLAVAVLGTSSVIAGEFEEKTSVLILSKPVSRLTFLVGKFLAVAASLILVILPLICVLIMTLFMGVPEAAYSEVKYSILLFELLPLIAAVVIAAGANYYADKHFPSTFIIFFNILLFISFMILYFLNKEGLQINLFYPVIFLWMSGIVMITVASVISLRSTVFLTLLFSFFVFVLGLTASYFFGKFLDNPLMRMVYSIIPDFQVFWVEEIWMEGKKVSPGYFWNAVKYMLLYSAAMLSLGWALWERRELT